MVGPLRPTINGLRGVGPDHWSRIASTFRDIIPPYPSESVVPTVTVPSPPLLDQDAPFAESARMVARAVHGAVRTRYPAITRNLQPPGLRHRVDIEEAVSCFLELAVSPWAWCAWSTDVWRTRHPRRIPSVTWLLLRSRMVERADWYETCLYAYSSVRVDDPPAHAELVRAWTEMQRRLIACDDVSETVVRECVRKSFRGGYVECVERAKAQALRATQEFADKLKSGECLW